jgi:transposase
MNSPTAPATPALAPNSARAAGHTIGLDLGDRRHHACVLDAAGTVLAEEAISNTREVLTAFCGRYPGATIIMETGTHSPWVSRLVAALGHSVHVANARKLRAISASLTKSDREDARMLFVGPPAGAGTRAPHPPLRSGPRLRHDLLRAAALRRPPRPRRPATPQPHPPPQ